MLLNVQLLKKILIGNSFLLFFMEVDYHTTPLSADKVQPKRLYTLQ